MNILYMLKKKNFKWYFNKNFIYYVCFLDWFCVMCGLVCVGVYILVDDLLFFDDV